MATASSQAVIQAAIVSDGGAASSQAVMLVAFTPPGTRHVRTSQTVIQAAVAEQSVPATSSLVMLSAVAEKSVPATSSAAMLVAYRTGSVENLTQRAWSFTFDGHPFYALTLGEQGTFLYDTVTGKWSKWQTTGLNTWNMELGTGWGDDGGVYAFDQANPVIWRLDPTSFLDDGFKVMTRRVSGALYTRNRVNIENYAVRLTASYGKVDVPLTDPATLPVVTLRVSDDQGNTFFNAGSVELVPGQFSQELQWLSLGLITPPMRIFEITDTGAVARISGADAELGDE